MGTQQNCLNTLMDIIIAFAVVVIIYTVVLKPGEKVDTKKKNESFVTSSSYFLPTDLGPKPLREPIHVW